MQTPRRSRLDCIRVRLYLSDPFFRVAELSNRMHFLEPKVAQIADYERQIEQLGKHASMWV